MTLKEILVKRLRSFFPKSEKTGQHGAIKKIFVLVYPLTLLSVLIIYAATYNYVNNQKTENELNLINFFKLDGKKIENQIFKNLNSPYIEFNYKIENNDSIEKILRKFKISDQETQKIINGLKERKLTNVYAGRELKLIIKKVKKELMKL